MVPSLVAQYDEFIRCTDTLIDGTTEIEFLKFVRMQDECRLRWLRSVHEAERLQRELDSSLKEISNLETKLFHARKLLEEESRARKRAEHEREAIEKKMVAVCDIVRNEQDIKDETRERLAFMRSYARKRPSTHVEVGNEINSTGSFLSDLSLTQSEDDFLDAKMTKNKSWKKHRPSHNVSGVSLTEGKKSRLSVGKEQHRITNDSIRVVNVPSEGNFVAHAKVTIPQDDGPILAESIIQTPQKVIADNAEIIGDRLPVSVTKYGDGFASIPKTPSQPVYKTFERKFSAATPDPKRSVMRQHVFCSKTFIRSELCLQCQQRIRFGTAALRCRECKAIVHSDCRDLLSVACVPQCAGTPTAKGTMGYLVDYSPKTSPMIPGLVVHCVTEIETRGLTEVGLYRIPGSDREIRALKEKFLRGKTVPCLASIDVNVLCGCVKDFLRTLREPLIPVVLWKEFANAVEDTGTAQERSQKLYYAIARMPPPNRDTLAFLIQHFQRIAQCPEVKMSLTNLSLVFAPTIVGYSNAHLEKEAIFQETSIQCNVLESLLQIPTEYWSQFVNREIRSEKLLIDGASTESPILQRTRKTRKYYATPPHN